MATVILNLLQKSTSSKMRNVSDKCKKNWYIKEGCVLPLNGTEKDAFRLFHVTVDKSKWSQCVQCWVV